MTTAPALRYRTDIHCEGCVQRLKKVLDGTPGIHHWNADSSSPDRWVTIHGDITDQQARAALERADLCVLDEVPPTSGSAEHPALDHARGKASDTAFWNDKPIWRRASFNTLSCLFGCTIGDFAMIVYLQAYHPTTSMAVQMILATVAGLVTSVLLETALLRHREKLAWAGAFRMAVGMSFISMIGMEMAMNLTDFVITGGRLALSDARYWLAFIPSAAVGFLAPLPYNYFQLKKHNKACH